MSNAVRERRKAKAEAQGQLFETERRTTPARTPGWVIRELVDKWGLKEQTARNFAPNVAFAVMYQHRNGKVLTPERKAELRVETAKRLRDAADNPDYTTRELCDLTLEAACLLERELLARVVKGLANLLDTQKTAA